MSQQADELANARRQVDCGLHNPFADALLFVERSRSQAGVRPVNVAQDLVGARVVIALAVPRKSSPQEPRDERGDLRRLFLFAQHPAVVARDP